MTSVREEMKYFWVIQGNNYMYYELEITMFDCIQIILVAYTDNIQDSVSVRVWINQLSLYIVLGDNAKNNVYNQNYALSPKTIYNESWLIQTLTETESCINRT